MRVDVLTFSAWQSSMGCGSVYVAVSSQPDDDSDTPLADVIRQWSESLGDHEESDSVGRRNDWALFEELDVHE